MASGAGQPTLLCGAKRGVGNLLKISDAGAKSCSRRPAHAACRGEQQFCCRPVDRKETGPIVKR